jgi:hypothetical protein
VQEVQKIGDQQTVTYRNDPDRQPHGPRQPHAEGGSPAGHT